MLLIQLSRKQDVENPSGRNFVTVGMILVNLNKVFFACSLFQNMKLLKAVVQTEKLPIKVKSDVRRTLDGIFTNRFLLFQIDLLLLHIYYTFYNAIAWSGPC